MKLLKSFFIVLTLALGLSPIAKSGNIHDIKGTWDLLKPEYRAQLSPVCGALGIEFKYIEKLYHFGNPDDATVQLIKQLFHAMPGGFAPSFQNIPSKFFSIGMVGSILSTLELYKDAHYEALHKALYSAIVNDRNFGYQRYLDLKEKFTQKPGDLKNTAFQIIRKHLKFDYKDLKQLSLANIIQKLNECLHKPIESININAQALHDENHSNDGKRKRSDDDDTRETKRRKKEIDEKDIIRDLISKLTPYAEKEDLAKKFEVLECKNLKQNIEEFICLLVKACNECHTKIQLSSSQSVLSVALQIKKSLYRPYAAQQALLCWVYKKMDKKEDLFPFFANLDETFFIDKSVILRDGWKYNRYGNDEEKLIHHTFEQQFNNKSGQEIFDICSDDKFADLIFCEIKQQFYGNKIPVLPEWKNISYKGHRFADCMETTIRNLCNILTYDQKTALFGNQLKATPLSQALTTFYQTPANSTERETDTIAVREAWSDLIQNLPNISYVRLKPTQGSWYFLCPDNSHGFIKLDGITIPENTPQKMIKLKAKNGTESRSFNQIFINDASYLIVPESDDYQLYEIQASTHNLIVLMNNLFAFNLFRNHQEFSAHFFNPTFNSTYFAQLCQKCSWSINPDEIKKLDSNNAFIQQKLVVKTDSIDAVFALNMHPFKHAFTQRSYQVTAIEGYRNELKKHLDATLETSMHIATPMLFDLYPAPLKTTECAYRYIASNIFLNSFKDLVPYFIIKTKTTALTLVSLVSQIIKSLNPLENMRIYQSIAENLSKNSAFFINNKDNYQLLEAVNLLIKQITECENEEEKLKTLLLLCPILILHQKQALAIDIAKIYASHDQQKIKLSALKIFLKLVEKKLAYEEAKIAADTNIKGDDWRTCAVGLKIIKALVKQKAISNKDAEFYATEGLAMYQWQNKSHSIDIFIELIKKGFSFDAAIKAATHTIIDQEKNVSKKAYNLFTELFKKRHGFAEAFNVIVKNINSQQTTVQTRILELFSIFIQHHDGLCIILENAAQGDADTKCASLQLLSLAAEEGYGLQEIEELLTKISIDEQTAPLIEEIRKKLIDRQF